MAGVKPQALRTCALWQVLRDQLRKPANSRASAAKAGDQAAQTEVSDSEGSDDEDGDESGPYSGRLQQYALYGCLALECLGGLSFSCGMPTRAAAAVADLYIMDHVDLRRVLPGPDLMSAMQSSSTWPLWAGLHLGSQLSACQWPCRLAAG